MLLLTLILISRLWQQARTNWNFISVTTLQPFAPCGAGAPLFPPCPFTSSFFPFYFSLSFIGFTYFLLLSILSLCTRIVPLRFQSGGHRRRPILGLVCVLLCNLCYLYSLVKMHCGKFCSIWFSFVCSFSALTLLVGSLDSINQSSQPFETKLREWHRVANGEINNCVAPRPWDC